MNNHVVDVMFTDPPGPAAGHDLCDAFSCIVFLGYTEHPLDLSPVPDHVCLLRCGWTLVTQCRTETPTMDPEPL